MVFGTMGVSINYLAVGAAVVASFVIGMLWHGPLFGKIWMKEMKVPADSKPETVQMIKSLALSILGSFLIAYVLAHNSAVWHFMAEKTFPTPANPAAMGFSAGFFTWLGFFVPVFLNNVAFENRTWKLFAINAGYQFVNLQAIAMILSYWRA